MTMQRLRGTVARCHTGKGFAFLDCEGGPIGIFVHVSACNGAWPLSPGEAVSFEVVETPRGPRALDLRIEGGGQ